MKKTILINDPILGPIDITSVLPIIDHPCFQRLRFVKQMATSYLIFPGATHTRFEHSIGAYKRTQDRMAVWLRDEIVTEQQARDIEIFGLIHDIGHGPLSHLIEPLCSQNHDQRGAEIVENQLEDPIKQSGGNFKNIRSLFSHQNPLYKAVHDKNLGTEKFDYLERDAHHTGYSQRPGVNTLTLFVSFVNGELVIRPGAIDESSQLQTFYLQMYKNVYLRKGATVLQRMVQKMIDGLMTSGLREDQLWEMTDDNLMVEFRRSRKKWIRNYDRRFLERRLPKVAIALKQRRFVERDMPINSKALKIFGIDGDNMELLTKVYQSPRVLAKTELKIAKIAGLPFWSVLLLPVADPQRFVPQDIKIITKGGLDSLKEIRPNHFDAMEETAQSYASVKIAVFPEFRDAIVKSGIAQELAGFLIENAKEIAKTSD